MQEVHEDISDAAARRALEDCDGSEDAAAEALADTLFKHRMQVSMRLTRLQPTISGCLPLRFWRLHPKIPLFNCNNMLHGSLRRLESMLNARLPPN